YLLLFFATVTSVFAQTQHASVKGTITNEAGAPEPYLSIAMEGSVLGASTNAAGYLEINKIKLGTYTLHISGEGYTPVGNKIDLNQKPELTFNYSVKESQSTLNEVIVSAGRTPEALDETPASVHVVDQQTLKNQMKINPNMSAVLAATVPGLAMTSNT